MNADKVDLNSDERKTLEDAYNEISTRGVDDLPYTNDLLNIRERFILRCKRQVSERQVFLALKDLGRDGRLGGKFRKRRIRK